MCVRKYLPVSVWLAIHCAPMIAIDRFREHFWHQNPFMTEWQSILLLCFAPVQALLNGVLLLLVVGVVKGERSSNLFAARFLNAALNAVIIFTLVSYFLLLFGSWYAYSLHLPFFSIEDFQLLLFVLDHETLNRAAGGSATEIYVLLGLAFLGATLFWSFARPLSTARQLRNALKPILVFVMTLVGAAFVIHYGLATTRVDAIQHIANYNLSPSSSLLYGRVFFGENENNVYTPVDLTLLPKQSPSEYASQTMNRPRKNVFLFVVEAMRSDVIFQTRGGLEITPTINSLAQDGLNFSRAYTVAPDTAYAQSAIVTGQYPLKSLSRDSHETIDYPFVRIYDLLSELGYNTALLTFEWFFTERVTRAPSLDLYVDMEDFQSDGLQPFLPEQYLEVKSTRGMPTTVLDRMNVEIAKNWLKESRLENRPSFLMMYFYSSHFPYFASHELDTPFLPTTALREIPNFFYYEPALREVMLDRYSASLNYIDSLIAELIETIKSDNNEETLVIVTGDHGEMFHEHNSVTHGAGLKEEAIRVPLIVHGAGILKARYGLEAPVELVDIAPTVLDALGLPEFEGFQGQSILSVETLTGTENPKAYIMVQAQLHQEALIRWPWKIIVDRRTGKTELYNLENDPKEQANLAFMEEKETRSMLADVDEFRNKQLSYYIGENVDRENYFPPTHE